MQLLVITHSMISLATHFALSLLQLPITFIISSLLHSKSPILPIIFIFIAIIKLISIISIPFSIVQSIIISISIANIPAQLISIAVIIHIHAFIHEQMMI